MVKALVQLPVDVTVTDVAPESTATIFPANKSVFVAVLGVTEPAFAVKLKFGPKSAPSPELMLMLYSYFYFFIFIFIFTHLRKMSYQTKSLDLFPTLPQSH